MNKDITKARFIASTLCFLTALRRVLIPHSRWSIIVFMFDLRRFLIIVTLGWPVSASAEKFGVDDMAFLVGHWRAAESLGAPEEIWMPARAGVMTAIFRWPSIQGRYVIELLTVAEVEGEVIFRFKHFDPDVIAWEKNAANTYRLAQVKDGCATLDGIDTPPSVPARQQYCQPDPDTLIFRGSDANTPLSETNFVIQFERVANID